MNLIKETIKIENYGRIRNAICRFWENKGIDSGLELLSAFSVFNCQRVSLFNMSSPGRVLSSISVSRFSVLES